VKVLDFGLAKVNLPPKPVGPDAPTISMFVTSRGIIVGSLQYMAPEQLRSEPLDGRADLYSLGVVLYELATGEVPVRGEERWVALPAGLAAIVRKLRSLDRDMRYRTAGEVRDALQRLAFERCAIRPAL
jgi:serine/threonine protein kinase